MSMNMYEFTKYVKDIEEYAKHRWKDESFLWFKERWNELELVTRYKQDKFNYRFFQWIPDCVNTYYRYIVDVKVKNRNKELEEFAKVSGYEYFRVEYGDTKALEKTMNRIKEIRRNKDND